MGIAVYFYDSNAKLIKQGSLTVTTGVHYAFSETEVSIQQGDIGSHTIMAVFPDSMFVAGNTGIFGSFVAPNGNSNKLIPGAYQTSHIAGYPEVAETTFTNCALFVLDTAFYTYVAGRYLFAIGMVDATTGPIKKTALGNYIVDNGVDNFDENSLTASDYDNLLTAITNLTSGFGADISALEAGKQDATIRFDDAYLGVTIQTDIFPVASTEETIMGKIEVARDINPATVSDIPTVIYFHGVVVNTAGDLSIKNGSANAIVFGKAINGTGKIGFNATGLWVWIPISDNATKKNGLKAYISSANSVGGQTTNGENRITSITEVNTAPTGTSIVADMGVTWGQHITLASGETITLASKIYSALKVDALLASILNGTTQFSVLNAIDAFIHNDLAVSGVIEADGGINMMGVNKITNMANGADSTDAVNKGQMDTADALKANLAGGNIITGHQVFNNTIYTVSINDDGIAFYEAGVLLCKINQSGFYKKPTVTATGNYLLSGDEVAALISAHNGTVEAILSHPYILSLLAALDNRVDGLAGRGATYGEIAYTFATLSAMDTATRNSTILAAIKAGVGGSSYTATSGDLVYDLGNAVDDNTNSHEWEFNGTNWADNGVTVAGKASDLLFGLVKGGLAHANALKYTQIIGGEIHNLLADKTFGIYDETTGLLHLSYEELKQAYDHISLAGNPHGTLASEIATTVAEVSVQEKLDEHESKIDTLKDVTVPALGVRMTAAENDIDILAANQAANTLVNANEIYSRYQPTGELTNDVPLTNLAHKTANLNRLKLKGATIVQMAKNGNFLNANFYTAVSSTISVANNVLTLLASAQNGRFYQTQSTISGHVYHLKVSVLTNRTNIRFHKGGTVIADSPTSINSASYQTLSLLYTAGATESTNFGLLDNAASGWNAVLVMDFSMVDLTAQGNIPGTSTAWTTLTASQVDMWIGPYDTTAQIVAKAIAGGGTNKVTNGDASLTPVSSYWIPTDTSTISIESGAIRSTTATVSGANGIKPHATYAITWVLGHTYRISYRIKPFRTHTPTLYIGTTISTGITATAGQWNTISIVYTASTLPNQVFGLYDNGGQATEMDIGDYTEYDDISVYDITSYYMTSGIMSTNPLALTRSDGTTTLSTALTTVGLIPSLPDGTFSEYETYVEDDPASANFQLRMSEKINRALTIQTPKETGWAKTALTEMVLNGIDWTDSNADGLADNWTKNSALGVATIVSGKQRMTANVGGYSGFKQTISFTNNHKYIVKFDLTVSSASGSVDVNTGFSGPLIFDNILTGSYSTIMSGGTSGFNTPSEINFQFVGTVATGDYFEIDNVSIVDVTALLGNGVDATGAQMSAFLTMATNTVFEIDLGLYDGGKTITLPATCATAINGYSSRYTVQSMNALIAGGAVGNAISPNGKLYLVLANATADTTAELYTYLLANPLDLVVPITESTETITMAYFPQTGNTMTVAETSSTYVKGQWEVTYCKDANKHSVTTAQRPLDAVTGQMIFDSTLGKMIVYNGSAWINLDGTALA